MSQQHQRSPGKYEVISRVQPEQTPIKLCLRAKFRPEICVSCSLCSGGAVLYFRARLSQKCVSTTNQRAHIPFVLFPLYRWNRILKEVNKTVPSFTMPFSFDSLLSFWSSDLNDSFCIHQVNLLVLGIWAGWGDASFPDTSRAFSSADLPGLNSFNYKVKELIQGEGRGGGEAQFCQALSKKFKCFIAETLVSAKAFVTQHTSINTEILIQVQEFAVFQTS